MTVRIAIIGAGPKAAAIAAKAECYTALGLKHFEATIFERGIIGANWHGQHGYTDGEQDLCTPIVRDVGYPSTNRGDSIAERMQSEYS